MLEKCGKTRRRCGRCRRPGSRVLLGVGCILTALLLLLVCAPSWVVALIFACLLLMLGFWLLGFSRR